MKPNITPGPWDINRKGVIYRWGNGPETIGYRPCIGKVSQWRGSTNGKPNKEAEANAKAIAAVPEMIEALIKAYGLWWNEVYELAYGENMGDPEHAREVADSDPHVKQFKATLRKAGVEV